jgi:hypothetical protein
MYQYNLYSLSTIPQRPPDIVPLIMGLKFTSLFELWLGTSDSSSNLQSHLVSDALGRPGG